MTIQLDGTRGISAPGLQLFVGAVHCYPATIAPSGTVALSGQLLSRVTFASLYAFATASGNIAATDAAWTAGQFSPGDGSTTFRIPDYRGEFGRFWDNGRGVDASRPIGTAQGDALQGHQHTVTENSPVATNAALGASYIGYSGYGARNSSNPVTDGSSGAPRTAAETRPRNVAYLACIFTGVA